MASSQWTRAKELFDALLDADPGEPEAWIEQRCGDDAALQAEVLSLWRAYEAGPLSDEAHGADWLDTAISPDDEAESVLAVGTRIGAYRLTGEIGVGGMSVVYRAERAGDDYDQTVAIKLLQHRLHADDAEQRFRAERQVLASLDHPNITGLLDGGVTEGGRPYLVMEYVDGLPITEYAATHDLDLEARLDLLLQVADALQAAHSNLVVHRDLKPSNVLVKDTDTGPRVLLLDFGIAKLLDDSFPVARPRTRTGHHLLTPSYAAPEQVTGSDITAATDVYQWGVLAYELLSGTRPFEVNDQSLTEIERLLLTTDPDRPSQKTAEAAVPAGELAGDLDTIVLKALRKDPDRRYRSVEALAADLRRHRRREPIQARTATLRYRASKFVRRHRWGVGTTAAVLLVMAVALVGILRERNRAQQEAAKSERVSAFLVDLFEASDPNESQGDTLTARTLLQRGRERLGELEDAPAVQAEMMYVLGQTNRRLARYDTAQTLLRRSLALRREQLGREAPATLESLSALALLHRDRGHYPAADTLLGEVVRVRRVLRGPNHPSVIKALMYRSFVQRRRGNLAGAEASIQDALAAKRAQSGPPDLLTAELLFNQASLLRQQGVHDDALPVQRRSLALVREQTEGAHPGVVANLGNLALLHDERGDYAAADSLYQAAIEQGTSLYGPEHPEVAIWMSNLGSTYLEQFRYAEANSMLRRALAINRAVYDGPHPRTALFLDNLADTYAESGRQAKADSTYRGTLAMMETVHTPPHVRMAHTLRAYGDLLLRMGQGDAAAARAEQSLDILDALASTRPNERQSTLLVLARIRAHNGQHEAADSLARAVLQQARSGPDPSTGHVAQALDVRGTLAHRQGHSTRADSLYAAALQVYQEAEDERGRAAVVRLHWGAMRTEQAQYAAAESLLVRAHDELHRVRGPTNHHTRQARRALVSLYEAWGRPEAAEAYRRPRGGQR